MYDRPVEILYSKIDWFENSSRRAKGLLDPEPSDIFTIVAVFVCCVEVSLMIVWASP